ncbi:aspartate aminotransferase family protein [Sesbania bispinosa]|nr:aspartate aminotransferase family protein [Sesbania bispinosa]
MKNQRREKNNDGLRDLLAHEGCGCLEIDAASWRVAAAAVLQPRTREGWCARRRTHMAEDGALFAGEVVVCGRWAWLQGSLIVIGRGSSDVGLEGDGSLGDDGWWCLRRRRGGASY